MCTYVFPRTIWRVPYLSSNQKLLQMQEYTHVLMQLGTGSPQRGLSAPNSNSKGHATKRGLRVPNPNLKGHATKRGLDNWPGFLNSAGKMATSPLITAAF